MIKRIGYPILFILYYDYILFYREVNDMSNMKREYMAFLEGEGDYISIDREEPKPKKPVRVKRSRYMVIAINNYDNYQTAIIVNATGPYEAKMRAIRYLEKVQREMFRYDICEPINLMTKPDKYGIVTTHKFMMKGTEGYGSNDWF